MRGLSSQAVRPAANCICSTRTSSTASVAPRIRQRLEQDCNVPAQSSWTPVAQSSWIQDPGPLWLPVSPEVQQAHSPVLWNFYRALPPRPALRSSSSQRTQAANEALLDRTSFQVQLNEPPQQRDKQQKRSDFYANVGDAIRALRDDIPLLFVKELNYDIYREDIVFSQSTLSFKGLKNYKLIFWSLRFHGRLFFKRLTVEVVRIWQPEDHLIKMRWKVHGVPRVWWEAEGTFDGISTYKLDREGLIYEHTVDNVQLRDPPITNPLLYGLNYIMRPSVEPHHMPVPGS